MPHPLTLPALGIVALAGGFYLGEQSIADINPVHFQGPVVHPRDRGAVVAEWEPQPQQPSFAALYGWAEGRAARAEDCGDCTLAAAQAPTWSAEPALPGPVPPTKPVEAPAAEPASKLPYDFERYAYYPVSAEEAEPGAARTSYE